MVVLVVVLSPRSILQCSPICSGHLTRGQRIQRLLLQPCRREGYKRILENHMDVKNYMTRALEETGAVLCNASPST